MKMYLISIILFCNVLCSKSQDLDYLTTKILGEQFYHTISIGISIGCEHIVGFPKISYGLQSGKNQGFFTQLHFATIFGFTYSPGIEIGYRFKHLGFGYSISYLGTDQNHRFYKWTHNVNTQIILGPIMSKIGTPIYFAKKGLEFESHKYSFFKYKKTPINLEFQYFDFIPAKN